MDAVGDERGQLNNREGQARRESSRRSLPERERELAALEAGVDAATARAGRALLIEGPAGIGKSRLVQAARSLARRRGLRVLAACGRESESEVPFSVARQLLGRPPDADAQSNGRVPLDVLEQLFQLTADMPARQPLLIAVDDAEWVDRESLVWLGHLVRRLEELPVLAVFGVTWPGVPRAADVADALGSEPTAYVLRPRPLQADAVAALVRQTLTADAEREFCDACHTVSRGNPFLLHALLTALRAAGAVGTAAEAPAVFEVAPKPVARRVTRRVGDDGDPAMALLRAAAVLGDEMDLGQLAALAELDLGLAGAAADALTSLDVLEARPKIAFRYPIVRAAVYADLKGSYKAVAHKRAARLMRSDPASRDAVAAHLLLARNAGDAWVVDRLMQAARRALVGGSLADAVGYLRRALAEPPPRAQQAAILFELGRAELRAGVRVGIDRLARAVELAEDPQQRALAALELGRKLTAIGDAAAAVGVVEGALAQRPAIGSDVLRDLESALVRAQLSDLRTASAASGALGRGGQRATGGTQTDPARLSMLALCAAAQGEPSEHAAELASRALVAGRDIDNQDPLTLASALTALTWLDQLDRVWQASSETLAEASKRGFTSTAAMALCLRSHVAFRRGWIDRAEEDARAAIELVGEGWEKEALGYPTAFLLDALIERGYLTQAAEELAARGFAGQLPPLWRYNHLLDSRGRLRLAQGRYQEAAADLLECGRRLMRWKVRSPAVIPWRSSAARARAGMGDREGARRLASEELVLARQLDSRRALGIALRASGNVEGGQAGVELLEESARTLERSGDELQLAGALLDFGAMLRFGGDASGARDAASRALDIAQRIGATGLASRAREELLASGARPRRFAVRGLDALTTRQREVATLAARGLSNREIADALFVSENTVESHLRMAFRKLDISSRGQLAALLGIEPALLSELPSQ